jgi:hypothetical protein
MKKKIITKAIFAMGGNFTTDTLNNLSADTLKNLSADTLNNLSAYTLNNLSADTLNNLSADTLNNLSADTLNNLSADTLNNLSADTLNNLSADTLKNLSADTLKNLSAYTLKNLSADTLNNLSADTLDGVKQFWESIPKLEKPYSTLLKEIKDKKRIHNQSTFGPEYDPKENVCGTQMCTAGHIVNMAGTRGYQLQKEFGWEKAASVIHMKAHPDAPTQNFGSIDQADAIAYIEVMAEFENRANLDQSFGEWLKESIEHTEK